MLPHSNQLVVDAGQLNNLHVHAVELVLVVLNDSGGLGVVVGHLLVGDLELCEPHDGVLHLGVTLVGVIQGHLQLGDLHLGDLQLGDVAAVVGRGGRLVQLLVAGLPGLGGFEVLLQLLQSLVEQGELVLGLLQPDLGILTVGAVEVCPMSSC